MNDYFAAGRRFALVLNMLLLLAVALPATADNVLVNSGFDHDLSGWLKAGVVGREEWTSDDAQGSPSSGSAQLTFRDVQFLDGTADLFQVAPATAGKKYDWSVDVKNAGATPDNYAMTIVWCSDPACNLPSATIVVGPLSSTPQWKNYAGQIVAPAGTQSAAIHVRVQTGGSAFFDNVSFGPPSCLICSANVPAEGFAGQAIKMTADVQVSSCPISTFTGVWTFGDSSPTSTDTATTHTYTAPGTYQWSWKATNGSTSCKTTGTVTIVPPLHVASFTAIPQQIALGQSATLSWIVDSATSVLIDNGVGAQPASGAVTVTPAATTTYTLTAMRAGATVTVTATVQVNTQPQIAIGMLPKPILQNGGKSTYPVMNIGGAPSTVTLSQSSTLFTQQPASFTLNPGALQNVTLTSATTTSVPAQETSSLSGNGVPANAHVIVKMLNAPAGSGGLALQSARSRVDLTSTSIASVDVTNNGSGSITAVAWADVPWLQTQVAPVVIAPGATATVSFQVDRTQRPDAPNPAGSLEGALWLFTLSGGTQIANVFDTVPVAAVNTALPGLGAGEVDYVLPAIGHVGEFQTDVSLFNVPNAQVYFGTTAESVKVAALPSPSKGLLNVADIPASIFGTTEQLGTLHIRTSNAAQGSVSAVMRSMTSDIGEIVPAFRSDRGAARGETIVLSDLNTGLFTTKSLYVQETLGYSAGMRVDFYGADGNKLTGTTQALQSVPAFGLGEMTIPADAASAFITNISTLPARLVAYARLADATKDTWISVDWSRYFGYSPGEPVVIPIFGNVIGMDKKFYASEISITNRGSSAATGTLRYFIRDGNVLTRQISIGANQTSSTTVTDFVPGTGSTIGFVTFTPVTGTFAVTSSSNINILVNPHPNYFGAAVPVVAASSAMSAGGSKTIVPLEDADRHNSPLNRRGMYRTNLGMMETTGHTVTVRVTLRYPLPIGGRDSRTRDFTLGPNQFLLLPSIADHILGPLRLNLGDLRDLEADFQVVGGDGAAIVFTSTVSLTGDSFVRVE